MATDQPDREETINVVKRNWRAEVETAQAYRDLAGREKDEKRKGILIRMAEAEERHAQRWEKKLRDLGENRPALEDTLARRLNRWRNAIAGADIAIRRMEAAEEKHEAEFRDQRDRALAGEEDVRDFLRESALEEKAHARALKRWFPQLGPRTALDAILKRERWHGRGGSWVADAIYGANDGLGAVFGIVSGVAGATNNQQHYVLISGLAGMLASTLSMGAGAYLAAKSEAEVYEAEISRERAEVEENPEEEIEEMSLFYQLQGFSPEESQRMAERLAEQPEQFVQAMAQSELGLSEHRFPNPLESSAFSAGISTAIGAFVPIIPFFLHERHFRSRRLICDQFGCALCRRGAEVAHHDPFLVGVRFGDDVDWRNRGCRHVRTRPGVRRNLIGTVFIPISRTKVPFMGRTR